MAIVTTGASDSASDVVVFVGDGVSRPLRYGLVIGLGVSSLGSAEDERRLRFDSCELQKKRQGKVTARVTGRDQPRQLRVL